MQTVIECPYCIGQTLYGKDSKSAYEVTGLTLSKSGCITVELTHHNGATYRYNCDLVPLEFSTVNPSAEAMGKYSDSLDVPLWVRELVEDAWKAGERYAKGGS